MSGTLPDIGTKVKVNDKIDSPEECEGFFVHKKHLDARKPGAVGKYKNWVPGCGGDVWWVEHDDGSVAAYMYTELTLMKPTLVEPPSE